MVLLLHTYSNSMSRSKTSDDAHSYGLHLYMYSMYSVTEGEDVNGTAKSGVRWAISLEQFAINSVRQQFVSESVHAMLAYVHYF